MLLRWLGDILSPPRCAACSMRVASRHVFCSVCAISIERCSPADDPAAFGEYGGALAQAIQSFKYGGQPHLAAPLGALIRQACELGRVRADLVIPVPLHPRRLVERGYNQSALLAWHVAGAVRAPLVTRALARVLDTPPQVELSRAARRTNVEGAFEVTRPSRVRGSAIALVDDVSTTGSTMRACRDALLAAGATRVTSVVVARTTHAALGTST